MHKKSRARTLIGFAASLVLLVCLGTSSLAQTRTPTAPLQDIGPRFGLTPAQARDVYARLSSNDTLIGELSRETGVQRRTLQAVALELGARNLSLTPDAFGRLIRVSSSEAVAAQKAIASLERTVLSLDPGGERSHAASILTQAQAAFDEGRLEASEAQFAKLSFLRQSELAAARMAWMRATDLQAQSAALRGDVEAADRVLSEKSAEIARQREVADREQWRTELKRAGVWADNLGIVLGTLGEHESGNERLKEAVDAFRAALDVLTRMPATPLLGQAQNYLETAEQILRERSAQ